MKENSTNSLKSKCSHFFIIILGLSFHLIILWGVLDANFHSPIISGLTPIQMPKGFEAKRVIIFLSDGLRYRTFHQQIPPYLNSIIRNSGGWGISNTRIPTESRPGNIAVVAGLYEDPSALFKGWKENPVEFDSIFNQSRMSWIWGSPDIVSLFAKGESKNINGKSYPADWQDFDNTRNDTVIRLDSWVFNQYRLWLQDNFYKYKEDNQLIFYFHLLGCDTAGHSSKPYSKQYIDSMFHVDQGIREVVEMTEKYFEKGTTLYIFTSDHGMTDWGSHGSGSADETEVPFVVWGAGVTKTPRFFEIQQTDITPLISSAIGIPVPVNNEGILPWEILNSLNKQYVAKAFFINVLQLYAQVKSIRELIIGKGLANIYAKDSILLNKTVVIEKLLAEGNYDESILETKNAAILARDSLSYYRHYQTNRLLICLLLTWISWILLFFLETSSTPRKDIQLGCYTWLILPNAMFIVLMIPLTIEYSITSFKCWRLFIYGSIALFSTWLALRGLVKSIPLLKLHSNNLLVETVGVLVLIILMFFGLSHRWVFGLEMLIVIAMQKVTLRKKHPYFFLTGGILAIFPFLPVVSPEPKIYIVLISLVAAVALLIFNKSTKNNYVTILEILRLMLTILVCSNILNGKSWASWTILFSTPLLICMYPTETKQRMFGISISLLCPLALLSTSYEPLFYLLLSMHLQYWPIDNYFKKHDIDSAIFNIQDITSSTYFMFYMLFCFFGTGNIASISSFDPLWTRHFLTVFSPYTMAILILFKFVVPMILVGCVIRNLSTNNKIFAAALLMSDCLAIPLMICVKPYGSWLDIGSTISRFVIAMVIPCVLLLVYYVSKPLLYAKIDKPTFTLFKKRHLV